MTPSQRRTLEDQAAKLTAKIDWENPQNSRVDIRVLMTINEKLGINNDYLREETRWLTFEAQLPHGLKHN